MYSEKKCNQFFENLRSYIEGLGMLAGMLAGVGLTLFILLVQDIFHFITVKEPVFSSVWQVIIPCLPGFVLLIISDVIIPIIRRVFLWYIAEENRKYRLRNKGEA